MSSNEGVSFTDYRIAPSVLEAMVRGALSDDDRLRVPLTGGFMRGKSVEVTVNDGAARVDLSLEARFGHVLPSLGSEAQERVSRALTSMTGLRVEAVNVQFVAVLPPGGAEQ